MILRDDMFRIERKEGQQYVISFNADCVIYKAHFPGYPITPGVCTLKIIGELLEDRYLCKLMLKEVKNVKFINPISPLQDTPVTVSFLKELVSDDGIAVSGDIAGHDKTYVKFSVGFKKQ